MTSITVEELRCEYAVCPLVIESAQPRLSWRLVADRRGVHQTAYCIRVATTEEALSTGNADLWDSGQVTSDQSIHIVYDGKPLVSRQRAWWQVQIWDENGDASEPSPISWWEMGLLSPEDWSADWIGGKLVGGPHTGSPCPYLRKEFELDQTILSARLYVTALGLTEFYLNGQRVGDDVFTPGWTEYRKRVQYQVYDITGMLHQGSNVAGAILGDGWYSGHVGWGERQGSGDRPKLLAQLVMQLADGSTQTLVTDGSWKTSTGPILEADLLMGESYNAILEMPGWDTAQFDESEWSAVKTFDDPGIRRVAQTGPPVRRIEELATLPNPKKIGDGWIFDVGQNMVGRVRIKVRAKRGATFRIRYGEMLDAKEKLYTENLRSARATDYYTCKSDEEEIWEPRFTFHGFRYVELTSRAHFELTPDIVTGIVLHSDIAPTGNFECSDALINQLQHNIQWGQKGNFLEVPTDCPQRDERLGWTGDAQVFIRTASFNANCASFFTKWQNDIDDAQHESGSVPMVVPNPALGDDGGPAWADAVIICPWTIYQCYGDTRILADHYDSFVRYIAYLESTSIELVRCGEGFPGNAGFGDWLALDGSGNIDGGTPKEIIGTAFFAYSTRLLGRIAGVLGKSDDAQKYEQLFQEIKKAFIARFVTGAGLIAAQTQTSYVLALHFDLLPEELRPAAANALVQDIKRHGMHLTTGFVGTPYLPHVLTETGHLDIAYALLHQKTWPSWLYAVTQGATTIWERWDGWTHDKGFQTIDMNSFNHYAYGAIGDWLYGTVAGLDLDLVRPGYQSLRFSPKLGGGLTSAKATYQSLYGLIVSDWHWENDQFEWHITVPPNATATVTVPTSALDSVLEGGVSAQSVEGVTLLDQTTDTVSYSIGSGEYYFTAKLAVG